MRCAKSAAWSTASAPAHRCAIMSALIRGSAQTENGDAAQAIDVMRGEIARLYRERRDTSRGRTTRSRYLTGSFALGLDSNSNIAASVHGYQTAGPRHRLHQPTQRSDPGGHARGREPGDPATVQSGRVYVCGGRASRKGQRRNNHCAPSSRGLAIAKNPHLSVRSAAIIR